MNVSDPPRYSPKTDWLFSSCANTQTAERLCTAINATAAVHNLYPWFIARSGAALYIVTHRRWAASEQETKDALAYIKTHWPDHPHDVDQSCNMLDPLAGQDAYRKRQPRSGRDLEDWRSEVALAKGARVAARTPRKSRQDAVLGPSDDDGTQWIGVSMSSLIGDD